MLLTEVEQGFTSYSLIGVTVLSSVGNNTPWLPVCILRRLEHKDMDFTSVGAMLLVLSSTVLWTLSIPKPR